MSDQSGARSRRAAQAAAAYRKALARLRQVELRLERRYPKLYDARHAAAGIGRAQGPLLGAAAVCAPGAPRLGFADQSPAGNGAEHTSIDLPSFDRPEFPAPNITPPGWLRAIGGIIGAVLSVLAPAAKYMVAVVVVLVGVGRTREAHRRRKATERVGRQSNEPAATGRGARAVSGSTMSANSSGPE